MSEFYWRPARTLRDLDEAQRLRFHCISVELGIRFESDRHVERDVSRIDCLNTTEHVLVYQGQRCVATARVALPNRDLARARRTRLGLELEDAGIDLGALRDVSSQIAEISGLFVLRQWHGTAAAARLYEGLYVLTRQLGARYWLGGVDCQTSCLHEAELMRLILSRRGRVSTRYRVESVSGAYSDSGDRCASPTSIFYTPKQLQLAEQGQPEGLPIAGALTAFTKRLGATCIGRPALHPRFPRYVLPMLVDLRELPPATLRMFDRGQLAPLQSMPSATVPRLDAPRIAS